MRYVKREFYPVFLESDVVIERKAEVNEFLRNGDFTRPPRLDYSIIKEITPYTADNFKNKCAYCERLISKGVVDHFRPKGGAADINGEVSSKHYCWLMYEPGNLYYSCNTCNSYKRNFFPVKRRGKLGSDINELTRYEEPYLLDPCYDRIEDHLEMDDTGHLLGISERGHETIRLIKLNRASLIKARREILQKFHEIVDDLINDRRTYFGYEGGYEIKKLLMPEAEYSGCLWLYWRNHLDPYMKDSLLGTAPHECKAAEIEKFIVQNPNNFETLVDKSEIYEVNEKLPPSYSDTWDDEELIRHSMQPIRRVVIRNFKGISNLDLDFPEPDGSTSWLALLGDNSVGKTCILQAITLGLIGGDKASHYINNASKCVGPFGEEGSIDIYFWNNDFKNSIYFNENDNFFYEDFSVRSLVLSYGANRIVSKRNLSKSLGFRSVRCSSIFNDRALVNSPKGLFSNDMEKNLTDNAKATLDALLPSECTSIDIVDGKVVLEIHGVKQDLDHLSSGFKNVVSIACEIMDVLFSLWGGIESAQGIVIIDEIDAHLHPSWKLKIVDALRNAFPMVQFIISTHDPLVLRGMEKGEVSVLFSDNGEISVSDDNLQTKHSNIDHILTSELFGLESTHSAKENELIKKYYELINNGLESNFNEIKEIRSKLSGFMNIGHTERERLLLELIDVAIAESRKTADVGKIDSKSVDFLYRKALEKGLV